tara:strand:+ start:139 stop:543 length:405 start_codon:yes stop_codon:yes gene_type:complete
MRILLLFLTLAFTQELEVEGDLKVTGNIDAQNQAIKNVGVPQELTDAINGNVLQDALRDDGPFEFVIIKLHLQNPNSFHYITKWYEVDGPLGEHDNFVDKLAELSSEGYVVDRVIGGHTYAEHTLWVFKRAIEE